MKIEISSEQLKSIKLMVATPMYGGMCNGQFMVSMMQLRLLCAQYGIEMYQYFLSNESLITRARAYAADEFMRSDATHLLFIDSDIGFNPEDAIALVALNVMDKKYSIIGGPYPKKNISWEKIKHAVDSGIADKDPNLLENFVGDYVLNLKSTGEISLLEPIEVAEIGTGFMMIDRKVFEKMDEAYPELRYKPDHARTENFDGSRNIMMYFDCEIDRGYSFGDLRNLIIEMIDNKENSDKISELIKTGENYINSEKQASMRYLSEDYLFCRKADKLGFKTWICPWMKLTHTGSYVFGGSLIDVLSIGANPTADVKYKPKKK